MTNVFSLTLCSKIIAEVSKVSEYEMFVIRLKLKADFAFLWRKIMHNKTRLQTYKYHLDDDDDDDDDMQ